MTIGRTLKVLRVAAGLQQKDLAQRLGVTANYVSLVETERREPSLSYLRNAARALGVPVSLFFLGEDDTGAFSEDERAHLTHIRELLVEAYRLRLERGVCMADEAP